jgi:hypothetical protein
MSKPQSIIIDPWTDFPKQPYHSILRDDFCHDKTYVEKLQFKNDRGTVNLKAAVDYKKDAWKVTDEVKFWFQISNNRSLYAKIKSSDYVKWQYDHGTVEWQGRKWNVYAGMNTDKTLQKMALKVGVSNLCERLTCDNRIRWNWMKHSSDVYWYNRSVLSHQKWKFTSLSVYDFSNKVLQKNNILVSYTHDNQHSAYLRAEVKDFRKKNPDLNQPLSFFDNLIFNYVNVVDEKTKAAVEVSSYSIFRFLIT